MNTILDRARAELREIDSRIEELHARKQKLVQLLELSSELGYSSPIVPSGLRIPPPPPPPPVRSSVIWPPPPLEARQAWPPPSLPVPAIGEGEFLVIGEGVAYPSSSSEPMKDRAANACEELLRWAFPRRTRELEQSLFDMGIVLGGQDRVMALSAILSKDGRFTPNRKHGWRLKDQMLVVPGGTDDMDESDEAE